MLGKMYLFYRAAWLQVAIPCVATRAKSLHSLEPLLGAWSGAIKPLTQTMENHVETFHGLF